VQDPPSSTWIDNLRVSSYTLDFCGTAAGVEDRSKMLVASLNHHADVP